MPRFRDAEAGEDFSLRGRDFGREGLGGAVDGDGGAAEGAIRTIAHAISN